MNGPPQGGLTRCPACATVFRITEAQLAARQGFVRCGQCAKVFDARASLIEEAAAAPELETEATAPPAPTTAEELTAGAADSEHPVAVASPVEDAGPPSEPLPAPEPESSPAETEPAPAAFEFGPRHRARSRVATALWGLGSVLAVAALAAQATYWFRTELATAVPETRPYLAAACRALGCVIPPPRQIALLSIESSELQVDRYVPGLLTLNATLRNRATFAQAHPSIEVTLTDSAERPLARRVLAPADYLGERLAREPLFAAASEHTVQLHIDATAYRPTGYRLFLFHP
jgi:predicted Zn finger-like uncharacterized protein